MILGRALCIPSNELISIVVAIIHQQGKKTSENADRCHFKYIRDVGSIFVELISLRLKIRFSCNIIDYSILTYVAYKYVII